MKRQGELFERIFELKNLQLAYLKARRGKLLKNEVYTYGRNLDKNLRKLQNELNSAHISFGNYHSFTVFDPKERTIYAAPFHQRVMHHALMNVCHDRFEKAQINDSYASRIGKGTYAALNRAKINCGKYDWFLKLDVNKFFDNIDHDILKLQLRKIFKDSRVLSIFDHIIESYHRDENKGVPIGNLTSQYFANHYLTCADHYIKEKLGIAGYIRYMDDMVLWNNSKEHLKETGSHLQSYFNDNLHLDLKPFCLNRCSKGLPFLGYLIYPGRVLLSRQSKKRFIRKLCYCNDKLDTLEWSQEEYQNHVEPLIAFTDHADALGFRQKIILEMN